MDESTMEAIDFQYILNKIDTLTPYGTEEKNGMKAFKIGEEKELREQLNILESYIPYIKDNKIRREFNNLFSHIKDLKTSIERSVEGFILTEVELFEIKNLLIIIRRLEDLVRDNNLPIYKETEIKSIEKLEILLDPEGTGTSTFYIYDEYSNALKNIRRDKLATNNKIKLVTKNIKEKIKQDLNLSLSPDNSIQISRDKKALIERLEDYPYLTYVSETYMSIKFTIKPSEEITLLEGELRQLNDEEEKEELEIRENISKEIGNKSEEILRNMKNIGRLDLLLGKAKLALDMEGVKPEILKEHTIVIEEGRHTKVEDRLKENDLEFTPISINLKSGVSCITGANMGGKTISIKLTGLLAAMAQYGLYVPAKSMSLGLNQYIKTSIGDMQSTDSGLSTFGGEIKVVGEAIERADERGLILIDELARGTNPEEGFAISKAIVKYLINKQSITLLTTHYDNVTNIEGVVHLQVVGLSRIDYETLKEELKKEDKMEIINKYMDYRLKAVDKGKTIPREAINIAKIMGLNPEIITIAEEVLGSTQSF